MDQRKYLSFEDILTAYPFSAGTLRRYLFNRKNNGLIRAVLKRERKILFNRDRFEKWIEEYFTNENASHQDSKRHLQGSKK